jgi:dienelactone hydrolase
MAPLGSHDLRLTAETAADRATATVTVRHAAAGVERHVLGDRSDGGAGSDGDDPVGVWFEPSGEGPHPAVVHLHGSNGEPMVEEAGLLASEGVAACALRYLGGDLPDVPRGVPLEAVEARVERFLGHDAVDGERYGLYGVSMGAQLALVLATTDERVAAAALDSTNPHYYTTGESSAWTRDGETLPCIGVPDAPPETWDRPVEGGVDRSAMWTGMLEAATTDERRAAAIPVEAASAELLVLSGNDDMQWPATTFANVLLARLDALGYDRPYEHHDYHDAGHGFGAPGAPTAWRPATGGGLASGGTPAAHAAAVADAWPRVVSLFERTLGDADGQ